MRGLTVLHLGVKELRGLWRDRMMLVLVLYAFTFAVYTAATAMPETLSRAPSPLWTKTARRFRCASSAPSTRLISPRPC